MGIISWIKNNKLTVLLGVIVLFLLFRSPVLSLFSARNYSSSQYALGGVQSGVSTGLDSIGSVSKAILPVSESAPNPEIANRMVVEESNVSLVVDNVREKLDLILDETSKKGGYMVSSSLNQPQDAPYASLVIRVPSKELRPTLEYLRKLSIKVTSENLLGTDVTDQYVDIEARLETLNKTKAKFEEILARAVNVSEIMQVQQQIISLQDQIDRLKGQQQYLEKNAANAKLTIYLSTDEWALPYAPSETFRPNVIFKEAVRSMVATLRGLAKLAIWLGVYSIVWVPVVVIIWFWRRRRKSKLAGINITNSVATPRSSKTNV
jgi:hypothetical protein